MKNLLREAISLEQLRRVFQQSPVVGLLPAEGEVWVEAGRKEGLTHLLGALKERALLEADEALPVLTDELYADFTVTGTRINFEHLYFERRRRLARAAIATLVETNAGKRELFRGSLHRKAEEIFAEVSWALPAHVSDPSGKDPMMIDLFAAESANQFAELITLFPESMPAGFVGRVRKRLREEFFENYVARDFSWQNSDTNWNAVCHQGVLGAALGVEDDAELLGRMAEKAARYLPNFLKGYTAEGATAEGPGYWSYGFGWFAELNAQLEKRTRNMLSLFEDDAKVGLMARFGPAVALTNGNLVNFADSAPSGGLGAALLQYLGDRLGDEEIKASAAYFWASATAAISSVHNQRADLLHWTRLILRCPEGKLAGGTLPLQDVWFPEVGWMVVRSKDAAGRVCEFAAKAGHNLENHNHNDVGSFLLNIDGQRILLEVGAPEYVKAFFRKETRYGFFAARSLGHSVPLVNGREQPDGAEFRGTVVAQGFTEKEATLVVDFTAAYPAEAKLIRGVRRMVFDKEAGTLSVRDRFELSEAVEVETAIITPEETTLEDGAAVVRSGGVTMRIVPEPGSVIRKLEVHEYKTHGGKPGYVTRVAVGGERKGRVVEVGYVVGRRQ